MGEGAIKLMITDFDGTLVNTYAANLAAYKKAFAQLGLNLSAKEYRRCFGYRFERFMQEVGIQDKEIAGEIKRLKSQYYPEFFDRLQVNTPLLEMLRAFRRSGGMTAIASTARRVNLCNALSYIGAQEDFDLILAGEDVVDGKPSPEIYLTVLSRMNVSSDEAIVFEDSEVGFAAAESAGIRYMKITESFYGNRG